MGATGLDRDGDREGDSQAIAAEAFAALGTGKQVKPFSARFPGFALEDAYRVAAEVRRRREARGERPLGRKIGFTNRTIWDEYKVHAPVWGYVYDTTVHDLAVGWRDRALERPRRAEDRAGNCVWHR